MNRSRRLHLSQGLRQRLHANPIRADGTRRHRLMEGAPESASLVVATRISDPVTFRVCAERVAVTLRNWLSAIPLSCRPPRALLGRWSGDLRSPVAAGSSVSPALRGNVLWYVTKQASTTVSITRPVTCAKSWTGAARLESISTLIILAAMPSPPTWRRERLEICARRPGAALVRRNLRQVDSCCRG